MHVPDHTNKQVRKEFDQAQGSRPNDNYLSLCKLQQRAQRGRHPISLYDRRASLSSDLFNDIVLDINHKLAGLLPPKAEHHRQLRSNRKFNVPVCKTDRLKKSFIVSHSLRM